MTFYGRALPLVLLLSADFSPHIFAQNTESQTRPELNIHVHFGERARIVFQDTVDDDHNSDKAQGNFTYFFEYALRPVFRRELRNRDDVFRSRYLTIRGGYRYRTGLTSGDSTVENRIVTELSARYPLPAKVVILDRSRKEFRFIKGEPFSWRYRNRLWIERDFELGRAVFTPYINGELYYDSRHHAWTTNAVAVGVQIPIGPHVVPEMFYMRRNESRSTPPHVHVTGFILNLYF